MFKIKASSEVVAKKSPVFVGAPDNTYPDLVFTTDFSRDIVLPMNSIVLRNALLNSKEFLEKYLKIKVVDLSQQEAAPKPEAKKPKKEIKKKVEPGEVEWK